MDPNANLAEQRKLATQILKDVDTADDTGDWSTDLDNIIRLAELVEALDKWMSKSGFSPVDWGNGLVKR